MLVFDGWFRHSTGWKGYCFFLSLLLPHCWQQPGSHNYQNIYPPSPCLHLSNIPWVWGCTVCFWCSLFAGYADGDICYTFPSHLFSWLAVLCIHVPCWILNGSSCWCLLATGLKSRSNIFEIGSNTAAQMSLVSGGCRKSSWAHSARLCLQACFSLLVHLQLPVVSGLFLCVFALVLSLCFWFYPNYFHFSAAVSFLFSENFLSNEFERSAQFIFQACTS